MAQRLKVEKTCCFHCWTWHEKMLNLPSPCGLFKRWIAFNVMSVCLSPSRCCSLTGSSPQAWLESTTGMWKGGAKKTSWKLQTSLNIDSATFTPPLPSPSSSTNTNVWRGGSILQKVCFNQCDHFLCVEYWSSNFHVCFCWFVTF